MEVLADALSLSLSPVSRLKQKRRRQTHLGSHDRALLIEAAKCGRQSLQSASLRHSGELFFFFSWLVPAASFSSLNQP